MKKSRLIAVLMSLVMIFSCTAYAAATPTIEAKQIPFTDTVDVKISNATPNALITVKITNSADIADFYEVGYVDGNGNFEFSYINDRNSGEMTVTAQIGIKRISGSYFKMGETNYNEFINVVNTQHDLQDAGTPSGTPIKAVFDSYDGKFTYEKTAYNTLSDAQKENVFDIMAKDPSFKGDINEFKDVIDAFYAAVLVECYNENPDDLKNMSQVSPYKEVISEADVAPVLSESIKAVAPGNLSKVWDAVPDTYTESGKLFKDVEFEIFRTQIVNATSWNDVKTMYTLYKELLGVNPDNATYNEYKKLIGLNLDTYEAYRQAFVTAAGGSNPPSTTPPGNIIPDVGSTGPIGGGGGAGGKGSGSIAPIIPSTDINNNPTDSTSNEVGKLVFDDLTEATWAIKAVNMVHEKGIMVGVGDGKFEPNRDITRAEAIKIVMLMTGKELGGGKVPFEDVKPSDWFYPYVAAAYELGIVKGKSETFFDAHSLVSRQEMAVMVFNALTIGTDADIDVSSLEPNIVDKDLIAPWAIDSVKYLYAKNIMSGRLGYLFDPVDNMTRAEAATVIYNIIK